MIGQSETSTYYSCLAILNFVVKFLFLPACIQYWNIDIRAESYNCQMLIIHSYIYSYFFKNIYTDTCWLSLEVAKHAVWVSVIGHAAVCVYMKISKNFAILIFKS